MTFNDHYKLARALEADHKPDGWPAVQMETITALLNRLDALTAMLGTILEDERSDIRASLYDKAQRLLEN